MQGLLQLMNSPLRSQNCFKLKIEPSSIFYFAFKGANKNFIKLFKNSTGFRAKKTAVNDPAPYSGYYFLYLYEEEYISSLISSDNVKDRHFPFPFDKVFY